MKKPLLSIVVPTKNRYVYLYSLIKLIDSFKSDDIELVIQDNSDDNTEFFETVNLDNYPFIHYFYETKTLSQAGNSELSIKNSTGEYVCFIGDDDGVTKGIIEQVKSLKDRGLEAMITRSAVYNWPDYKDDSIFNLSATLTLNDSKKSNYILNSKEELRKVANSGFANLGLLPKVYQGVVSRAALNRLYDKCGSYFPGPSPDMANAVALTAVIDEYLYSDEPTIITGQSKFVGGGERLLKKLMHLNEIPQLPKDIMSYWDNKLPTLWCTDTIWPGSAIIAANRMSVPIRVNYDKIYGRFISNHPSYATELENFDYSKLKVEVYKKITFLKKVYKWAYNRLTYYTSNHRKIGRCLLYRNLETINQVADVLTF